MRMLLSVDGSPASLEAVRHAIALVRAGLRAEALLVNVQEPASLYEVVVAHDAAVIEAVSESAAAHVLAAARAQLDAAGIVYEVEIGHGDPAQRIVDIAERSGSDLIVIGAHGKDAPTRTGLGEVATAVLHRAAIGVLVVKPGEGN